MFIPILVFGLYPIFFDAKNFEVDPWGHPKYLIDPRELEGDPKCNFFHLKLIKQLLLVTFSDTPVGIRATFRTHGQSTDILGS